MERDTGKETQRQTVRDREGREKTQNFIQRQTVRDGEGRDKTQNFITQGLRL